MRTAFIALLLMLTIGAARAAELSPGDQMIFDYRTPGGVQGWHEYVDPSGTLNFQDSLGGHGINFQGANLLNTVLPTPSLSSPTITGTVGGGASYTAPTLTNPTETGTVSGGANYSAGALTPTGGTSALTLAASLGTGSILVTACGSVPNTGADQSSLWQACDNTQAAAGGKQIVVPAGAWTLNSNVTASSLNQWVLQPGASITGSGQLISAVQPVGATLPTEMIFGRQFVGGFEGGYAGSNSLWFTNGTLIVGNAYPNGSGASAGALCILMGNYAGASAAGNSQACPTSGGSNTYNSLDTVTAQFTNSGRAPPNFGNTLNGTLSSLSWLGGTVTAVVSGTNPMLSGDIYYVAVTGASPSGYNYTGIVTATSGGFTYPISSNPGSNTTPGLYATTIVAGSFTSTTFVPTTPMTAAQIALLRVGMSITTNDSTPYWASITGWDKTGGTYITVAQWCPQNFGSSGCTAGTPSGSGAIINSIGNGWHAKLFTLGGSTTRTNFGGQDSSAGMEWDVNNDTGIDDAVGTLGDPPTFPYDWGIDVANGGTNEATSAYDSRGKFQAQYQASGYGTYAYLVNPHSADTVSYGVEVDPGTSSGIVATAFDVRGTTSGNGEVGFAFVDRLTTGDFMFTVPHGNAQIRLGDQKSTATAPDFQWYSSGNGSTGPDGSMQMTSGTGTGNNDGTITFSFGNIIFNAPTGTPATYACFDSTHHLLSSSTAC